MKTTESFYVSPSRSKLCGVVVKTPNWKFVGSEFKYRNFIFLGRKPSLISLILNTEMQKHDCIASILMWVSYQFTQKPD